MAVRRATYNTTLAIGYTTAGDLDTATLVNFCTAAKCYVARLNFQGESPFFDLVQTAAANQPQIVSNGVLMTYGPKNRPALYFAGSPHTAFSITGWRPATNSVVTISASAPAYCKIAGFLNPAEAVASSFAVEQATRRR